MEALRREAPLEWRHKFLAYQRLKQSLEDLSVARTTRMPGEPAKTFDCHNDVSFFPQLHEEVERINREFTTAAKRLINKPGQGWLEFCLGSLVGRPGSKDLTLEEIASKAEWCVRFAVINSVALKKIVKAHDNYCSCRSANAYFQACRTSPCNFKGDSEIVYLPMLPALAASSAGLGGGGSLQIFPTTTSSLSGAQDKIAAPFGHQGGMQEGEDVEDPPVLSEHSCPICLEAMYQPIGGGTQKHGQRLLRKQN
ncbi:g24 [Coccomyxa elongata]